MNKSLLLIFVFAGIFFSNCGEKEVEKSENIVKHEVNPAHVDFDLLHSDEKAMEIADKVMKSIGGRENWDNSKYLKWNFFGKRLHYWNKETGDIRIEILNSDAIILMNINTLEGKVKLGDVEPTKADSLEKYLELGKEMWTNDSYWMFMPFKLKDAGVTLKYKQKRMMKDNEYAYALELTFSGVGETPDNKYIIYVDTYDYKIRQWDFYPIPTMKEPAFTTTWENYLQYGNIELANVRST
ncbi:hypothetical protein OAA35_00410, partial [bacterium]|nr:hypothetical protein [bacterium]